ncbi:chaplin family protein [Streptomyces racemochromogenes]|uniref:Chaplin family protein n=1 Tax=Streptomyces racemochromogenes TaxID=67353 RepID=A0ABW7PNW1_9ACTN
MVRVRRGPAAALAAGAGAQGVAAYSPGVGSGNLIEVPTFGDTCVDA